MCLIPCLILCLAYVEPQHEADLLRHYTLSDEDLQNIGARRRPSNKLGFALQLCVLRYPGRLLAPGEFVPPAVVDFIGRQLDLEGDELADYAVRSETRHEHLAELRRLYGFRSFAGGAAYELGDRLREEAPRAQSNEDLVRRFVEACRHTRTILPATTTIERICADALVDAERRIEARIAERVPPGLRRDLEHLLEETVDAGVTRFVWLRQFEPGAWQLTCPPLHDTGVQGESGYRAEVVLAARWLSSGDVLWKRLVAFAERLARVLDLAAEYVPLRVVTPVRGAVRKTARMGSGDPTEASNLQMDELIRRMLEPFAKAKGTSVESLD